MPGGVGVETYAAWPTAFLCLYRHCAEAHRLALRLIQITVRNEYPKMRLLGVLRPRPARRGVAVIPADRQVYAIVADEFHKIRIAHHLDFRIEQ